MQLPEVANTIRDEARNVTYRFMAYREMTYEEMLMGVRHLHAQPTMRRKKKPIQNQTFTVLTLYGATSNL